jgi:hypothetical protein
MTRLGFDLDTVQGTRGIQIDITRTFNLGHTMRDLAKMQRHLDEVAALGIPVVDVAEPPMVSAISSWATLTADDVTVQRPTTSGEVEIVTIRDADGVIYVGVGSDHTDRALEAVDLPWSKQVAPNVVAPRLWLWEEISEHWNSVELECWIETDGGRELYQSASVSEFWTPLEMLAGADRKIVPPPGAVALFSGTVESLKHQLVYGNAWTIRMHDPVWDRTIEHRYSVTVLEEEILDNGLQRPIAQ